MTKKNKIILIISATLGAAIIVGLLIGVIVLSVRNSDKNNGFASGITNFENVKASELAIRCYSETSVFSGDNVKLNYEYKLPVGETGEDYEYADIYLYYTIKGAPYTRELIKRIPYKNSIGSGSFFVWKKDCIEEKGCFKLCIESNVYDTYNNKTTPYDGENATAYIYYEKSSEEITLSNKAKGSIDYQKDGTVIENFSDNEISSVGANVYTSPLYKYVCKDGVTRYPQNRIFCRAEHTVFPINEVNFSISFGRLPKENNPWYENYDDNYSYVDLSVRSYSDGELKKELLLTNVDDYDIERYGIVVYEGGILSYKQDSDYEIPAEIFVGDYGELEFCIYGYGSAEFNPNERLLLYSDRFFYLKDIQDGQEKILFRFMFRIVF